MSDEPIEQAKATKIPQIHRGQMVFYEKVLAAVQRIGLKSLSTGNFGWFVLGVVAVCIIFRLSSPDLKDVLVTVFRTLGWLGYPCAGITVFASVKILRWREKFYNTEMQRNVEAKKVLMQMGFQLPLNSSKPKQ